jgi:KDO2-lipid IV(A) lauroyltransferase
MKFPLKRLRYAVSERILNGAHHTISHFPLTINRFMMDTLFFVSYPFFRFVPAFKRTVLNNLTTAFGKELTKEDISDIARRSMRNVFRMPGDVLYYCSPRRHDRLKRDVTISGIEHLWSAVAQGNGVIGLGAHMTGFLLLTTRLAQGDIPFVILTKDQRNTVIRNKLTDLKDLNGVRYIDVDSPDKGKGEIMRCLGNNELVYLIADERKKRDGMLVPFFGKEALTAVGPAVFSLKTGAPIVPIFIASKEEGFVIDILPPLGGAAEKKKRSVFELTCLANRTIEDYIRKYPDQWVWMQQRWRL